MPVIYKQGNLLRIRNVQGRLRTLLREALTYNRKTFLATRAQQLAAGSAFEVNTIHCFAEMAVDGEPQMQTNVGYLPRITKMLADNKIEVEIRDLAPSKRVNAFEPVWDNAKGFDWRHRQKETLECILAHERGQIWWATGAGKSWLMVPLCLVLPKARIVICTKHLSVLGDHYDRLRKHLPSVGIINGTTKEYGERVTCVSAGSLHKMDPTLIDVFIADEHHELATDVMFEKFSKIQSAHMFGLSANFNDRADGADFELEGVFGPLITKLTYDEGVTNDMIVPIEVHWRNVPTTGNPAQGKEGMWRKKYGIWQHKARNKQIAADAKLFTDEQVLITVETLEHACHLKKYLPEFTLCYAASDVHVGKLRDYADRGLISHDEPTMTAQRLFDLKRKFEQGELRKVIATTVWNRGVNFHELQVLIRADASSSSIADTQIPGRLARRFEGKNNGVLIDYLDEFDESLKRKSGSRKADYKKKGWKQILPYQEVSGVFKEVEAAKC